MVEVLEDKKSIGHIILEEARRFLPIEKASIAPLTNDGRQQLSLDLVPSVAPVVGQFHMSARCVGRAEDVLMKQHKKKPCLLEAT